MSWDAKGSFGHGQRNSPFPFFADDDLDFPADDQAFSNEQLATGPVGNHTTAQTPLHSIQQQQNCGEVDISAGRNAPTVQSAAAPQGINNTTRHAEIVFGGTQTPAAHPYAGFGANAAEPSSSDYPDLDDTFGAMPGWPHLLTTQPDSSAPQPAPGSYRYRVNQLRDTEAAQPKLFPGAQADFASAARRFSTNTSLTPSTNQRFGYGPARDDDADGEDDDDEEPDDGLDNTPTRRRYSGNRAPRTRPAVPRSDHHPRISRVDFIAQNYIIDEQADSGRNLFAVFDNDSTPRTRYNIGIQRGRPPATARKEYPPSTDYIPAQTTLEQICKNYPNHVWGTGLRVFMHEGMSAQTIWNHLPDVSRQTGCAGRMHNYIQQAIGRENDKIAEARGEKRLIVKRKKRDSDGDGEEKPVSKKVKANTSMARDHRPLAPRTSQHAELPSSRSQSNTPILPPPSGPVQAPGRVDHAFPCVSQPVGTQGGQQHTPFPPSMLPSAASAAVFAAAAAAAPPAPMPNVPRTLHDLQVFMNAELCQQDVLARDLLQRRGGRYATYSDQDWRDELARVRRNRLERHVNRLAGEFRIVNLPVQNDDLVGMITWIMVNNGATGEQPFRLVNNDTASLAHNWALWMLRGSTKWFQMMAQNEDPGRQ